MVLAVRVARGLAFTVLAASGRAVFSRAPRPALALGAALAAAVLAAGGWLVLRRVPPVDEPLVVRSGAARVVLVAVDGWIPELATNAVPLGARARFGYRKDTTDPAAFWTTVATGEPARRHGVGALELVRLDGLVAPVRLTAGTGWYLGRLLPALGLAREESVTSAARRVPSVWEVAHRGGLASLVVNWWTTWPAGDAGGVVLGNHLFFAARAGAKLEGEGWPPEASARAASLAVRETARTTGAGRLVADARGLDAFAIAAFRQEVARTRPRLALLYLPGLDILGAALSEPGRTVADRVTLATALGDEMRAIASFLAGPDVLGGDADLVAVVLDGGRSARSGELLLAGTPRRGSRPGRREARRSRPDGSRRARRPLVEGNGGKGRHPSPASRSGVGRNGLLVGPEAHGRRSGARPRGVRREPAIPRLPALSGAHVRTMGTPMTADRKPRRPGTC